MNHNSQTPSEPTGQHRAFEIEIALSYKDRLYDKIFYSPDGCWYWTGATTDKSYGNIGLNRGGKCHHAPAHRISYLIHKGEIPAGLFIRHSCDNRLCVNPDHLSVGTHKQNMEDMANRNRSQHGMNMHSSKLTNIQVVVIHEARAAGFSGSSISRYFKISQGNINEIISGRKWRRIKEKLTSSIELPINKQL